MTRRRRDFRDRLTALENANRADRWHFTLTDGTTASLTIGAVLDALQEAIVRTDDTALDERPALSRELRLLARVADDSEASMLGRLAVDLARQVVDAEQAEGGGSA
ncbi:hypothetical protein AB0B50_30725 [Streptomyces sp. NPDC041068]|uniref:hypothetical protein n=1 Tax=Streptomyces sp. NPDC041068 TaxID=3155130 RepID=UPI0033D2E2EF